MSDEEVLQYIQAGDSSEDKTARHNEIYRFGFSRAGVQVDEPRTSGELIIDEYER